MGQFSLFDPDLEAARMPGMHSGCQQLLIELNKLAGDSRSWTGTRSTLAAALGCSVDTVTRRKDKLVALGLIKAEAAGRNLTYTILRISLPRGSTGGAPKRRAQTSARRWWSRPDADQFNLPFEPATRAEIVRQLAATTMTWIGLVVSLVTGPTTRTAARRATQTISAVETTTEPTTPAAKMPEPATKQAETNDIQHAAGCPIEPITTTTIPTSEPNSSRPIKPIGSDGSLKKFCLPRNTKKADFTNAVKVEEFFERLLKAGGCTADEQLQFFRACVEIHRTARETDNVPGIATAAFRGAGMTPWRGRGSDADEKTARAMIASLKPSSLTAKSSDLLGPPKDERARMWAMNQAAQIAAAKAMIGRNA